MNSSIKSRWTNVNVFLSANSQFHEELRQVLLTDTFFKKLKCYQEVLVKELIPNYGYDHRFDFYIEELRTVIELHGEQHFKATGFGKASYEEIQKNFTDIQKRDNLKAEAAKAAGFNYVMIPYKHKNNLAQIAKQIILGAT